MDAIPPNRWVRHTFAGLARMLLSVIAGLVIWTILPVALGWQPTVVLSGSMEPAIRAGDVVLTREAPADKLRPGHVLLVENPAQPDHLLLHRYDHTDDDGGLVLRGDANSQVDSTAVAPEQVRGVGVLRVPWVGLPHAWLASGQHIPVGLTALGLLLLMALSPVRERPPSPDDGDSDEEDPTGDETASPEHAPRPRPRHAAAVGVGVAVTFLVVGGADGLRPATAEAAFTDTIRATASFTAGTWETDEPAAVPGDPTAAEAAPAAESTGATPETDQPPAAVDEVTPGAEHPPAAADETPPEAGPSTAQAGEAGADAVSDTTTEDGTLSND